MTVLSFDKRWTCYAHCILQSGPTCSRYMCLCFIEVLWIWCLSVTFLVVSQSLMSKVDEIMWPLPRLWCGYCKERIISSPQPSNWHSNEYTPTHGSRRESAAVIATQCVLPATAYSSTHICCSCISTWGCYYWPPCSQACYTTCYLMPRIQATHTAKAVDCLRQPLNVSGVQSSYCHSIPNTHLKLSKFISCMHVKSTQHSCIKTHEKCACIAAAKCLYGVLQHNVLSDMGIVSLLEPGGVFVQDFFFYLA